MEGRVRKGKRRGTRRKGNISVGISWVIPKSIDFPFLLPP